VERAVAANKMGTVDSIKGAILLRDRFERRGIPEPPPPGEAAVAGSLPLFHWVVNEPRATPETGRATGSP
jgi:hypothetical protein